MTERVRVTGPPRHTAARRPDADRGREPGGPGGSGAGGPGGAGTGGVDEVYLRSLLREQWYLAARVLGALALTVGLLPLAFHLAPALADREVLGLPLAWVLLGGAVHPLLLVLGWRYVRRAERNEQVYADLVQRR